MVFIIPMVVEVSLMVVMVVQGAGGGGGSGYTDGSVEVVSSVLWK